MSAEQGASQNAEIYRSVGDTLFRASDNHLCGLLSEAFLSHCLRKCLTDHFSSFNMHSSDGPPCTISLPACPLSHKRTQTKFAKTVIFFLKEPQPAAERWLFRVDLPWLQGFRFLFKPLLITALTCSFIMQLVIKKKKHFIELVQLNIDSIWMLSAHLCF